MWDSYLCSDVCGLGTVTKGCHELGSSYSKVHFPFECVYMGVSVCVCVHADKGVNTLLNYDINKALIKNTVN